MSDLPLKCIIVDDSTLQRLSIGKLVKDDPRLELLSGFSNAPRAKEYLQMQQIDLVFLDVEMPILSGFDLLDNLKDKPGIIFITGKTQYAFKAFDYEAIDFLQKPVEKKRFERAIEKAVSFLKAKENEEETDPNNYIFIKSDLKKHKVHVGNIRYIEAMGDYVKVVTNNSDFYTVLTTMKAFCEKLPEGKFLRIHKSYIINLSKVKSYASRTVQLEEDELPLSRNKKESLQEALNDISSAENQ